MQTHAAPDQRERVTTAAMTHPRVPLAVWIKTQSGPDSPRNVLMRTTLSPAVTIAFSIGSELIDGVERSPTLGTLTVP